MRDLFWRQLMAVGVNCMQPRDQSADVRRARWRLFSVGVQLPVVDAIPLEVRAFCRY